MTDNRITITTERADAAGADHAAAGVRIVAYVSDAMLADLGALYFRVVLDRVADAIVAEVLQAASTQARIRAIRAAWPARIERAIAEAITASVLAAPTASLPAPAPPATPLSLGVPRSDSPCR